VDEQPFLVGGAELLDVNIVAAFAQPVPQINNFSNLVAQGRLRRFLRPPVTISQVVAVDPARGAAPTIQAESMRSQKNIAVTAQRLEAHDLSGDWEGMADTLPDLVVELAAELQAGPLLALGFNYELTYDLQGETAAHAIGDRLLAHDPALVPDALDFSGGAARIFLSGDAGTTYTISVEPRANDPVTGTLWIAGNCNMPVENLPGVEELRGAFVRGFNAFSHVVNAVLRDPRRGAP